MPHTVSDPNPMVWLDDQLVPMYETPADAYDAFLAGELTEDELLAIGEQFDREGAY